MWKKPPNRKGSGGKLVFRPRTGRNAPVSPIGIVVVKFAHAIARVLKRMKIWAGRVATFGVGVTAPFVTVPDRRCRILKVVLVRRWVTWVLGIWRGEGLRKGLGKGRSVYKHLRPSWTDPVTARRVPSK